MNRKIFFGRSLRDMLAAIGPTILFLILAAVVVVKFVEPAPPKHLVITTGDAEGYYQAYAKMYQDALKEDGVELEIRGSSGSVENLKRLEDEDSDVEVGFVQDGIGDPEKTGSIESLGSLYFEPVWVFTRDLKLTRFSQLLGKRIAVGREGGGTQALAHRILNINGVLASNSRLLPIGWKDAAKALRRGEVDAAVFLATDKDPLIRELLSDPGLLLMNVDQAEGIVRQIPYLHHLVLPHGAIDLRNNVPSEDIHLIAPTATLLVRDSLHPALTYLLLKAADEIHGEPGLFEKKNEFPKYLDFQFPLNDEAKSFYKNGAPFWQRYLPFWLATLIERFIFFVIPVLALMFPLVRMVPKIYAWRVRSRIYQRYGELKFLEAQMKPDANYLEYIQYLERLDEVEERVNQMKVPLAYSDHLYILREHIDFVRGRLSKVLANLQQRDLEKSAGESPLT